MKKLRLRSKFWIEDDRGRPLFGAGRMLILKAILEHGSIRAAADSLGMSYRAVWGKIKTAEERLGLKLVETHPGGGPAKGARLTREAEKLIFRFERMQERGNEEADQLFSDIFSQEPKKK